MCELQKSFLLQILDIPKKTFPKLYELHMIDFSYNNITEIDRSVFVQLLSLRHLNFTHNHLREIESFTFGKIPTLLGIDLRDILTLRHSSAIWNKVNFHKILMEFVNSWIFQFLIYRFISEWIFSAFLFFISWTVSKGIDL